MIYFRIYVVNAKIHNDTNPTPNIGHQILVEWNAEILINSREYQEYELLQMFIEITV
jgi:hypothetical protein